MNTRASTDGTIALLNDVAEFLEGQADVRDGSDGPRPNKAMELMARAEIEIERLKRASLRGPSREAENLRMQIGYIATQLMLAGDKRSMPEIVEEAADACRATQREETKMYNNPANPLFKKRP
jgi:hypothetical protein